MNHSFNVSHIDQLRTAARQIVRELGFMHDQLAGTQLSPSAVHTIIELGYGTVANASALGELLRLEKSSISRLLMKLETDGLVRVDIDPTDKRVRNLVLTPKGTTLLLQIEEYARRQLQSALGTMSADELRTVEVGLFCLCKCTEHVRRNTGGSRYQSGCSRRLPSRAHRRCDGDARLLLLKKLRVWGCV